MLIDVVGIQHKQGTVEGRPYEFFEVHSLVPDAQVEGQAVDVIKLKPDVLSEGHQPRPELPTGHRA